MKFRCFSNLTLFVILQARLPFLIVRYGMFFRRISLLKLIFLLLWVQLGSD